MLHQINSPICLSALKKILQFQRQVLLFACTPTISLPLIQAELQAFFGIEIGDWLWGRLHIRKQNGSIAKTSFCKGIEQLNQYIKTNLGKERSIVFAFDYDVRFDRSYSNSRFKFRYKNLGQDARSALKILCTSLYTELLDSGFPPFIHSLPEKFNRDHFIDSFWKANQSNLRVCPLCDGPRSDRIATKIYDDADHFFPKKDYPFFAVHPSNLVPICLSCNRSFKGDRDPIDSVATEPLVNTFHPYGNPAINHINIDIKSDPSTKDILVIKITEKSGQSSRRVKSFNRLLKLEDRWSGRLNDTIVPAIEDKIRTMGKRLRRRKPSRDEEDLKEELQGFLTDYLDDESLQ
uniref:hypothetical protein n=1 Tax=Trichocoleus desertorum TaxID=1481672 RepID=UPI0025B3C3E3|nr:hypothetical protein [Trichocoleus desertorum]